MMLARSVLACRRLAGCAMLVGGDSPLDGNMSSSLPQAEQWLGKDGCDG